MTFTVYLFCLGLGTTFVLGCAIFGHLFGGGDHGLGGGHGHDGGGDHGGAGVSVFSPTIIASFITAFGGLGIIFSQFDATKPPYISAPLSAGGATLLAGILVFVMRQIFAHAEGSSESKISTIAGMAATVVSSIPENGVGEIAYVQAGTRYTAPAREEKGLPVSSGHAVTITRVVAGQFFVKAG
jgi:hypothetical protein